MTSKNKSIRTAMFLTAACLAASGCVVTKAATTTIGVAGKAATTTIGVAGKTAGAAIDVATPDGDKDEKKKSKKRGDETDDDVEQAGQADR
ncbi:MAG: stress responsive alpha-beta barrel [Pseudomonadota bacterium]